MAKKNKNNSTGSRRPAGRTGKAQSSSGGKRSRPDSSGKAGQASSTTKKVKKTTRKTGKKGSGAKVSTARKPSLARQGAKSKSAGAKTKRPGKTRLNRKHLDEFREILLQRRRMLLGDLNGMEENAVNRKSSGNLSTMPTHMADVGTDNFEHEFTLGLLESEQALLLEINQALLRIEDGTYGICLGTGRRIPLARLRAKPWAKYTIDYARMIEQGLVRAPEANVEIETDSAAGRQA